MNRYVWLFLLVTVMATAAGTNTYYVSTKGSNQNPGTEAEPLRTVQKAASLARAGDTILVRGGVYSEHVVLRFSGQQGKAIVLKNYPGERPVLQPGELGEQPPGHGLLLQAQQGYQKPIGWITIEGLEIRYGHDGVKFYNAHDIIIRRCHIHQNYNQGILGNGNRVLIDRNIIAGNGTDKKVAQNLMHGIYATGTAFTITNNLIHSNTAYGIQVAAYDYKKDSMAGPEYAEAKNWLIANNTIAFNKNRAGIVIWQDGVENCVVQNNIFYKNGGVNGILFYTQQGRRHPIRNNIFYPPGENLVATEDNAYEANENQQVDPQFVDADSFDFHLKAGSPAIDAGWADRAPKRDFEGKSRPQGDKVDIGAYEFKSAAPPSRDAPPTARPSSRRSRAATEAATPPSDATPHEPTIYFVAPNGSDDNSGTEEQPWATLRKATASVLPGDTVLIKAGVYAGTRWRQSAYRFTKAGTEEAPITYKAFGDGEVLLSTGAVIPPDSWKHVKGSIYSTPMDPKAGVMGVFRNAFPLVNPSRNHPVPSVDEMYPNSFYKDKESSTLYVWLPDGSNPRNSDMRATSQSVIGLSRCHYSIFDGLTIEYGYRGFNTEHTTRNITIRNCVIRSIVSQGIISTPEKAVIENNLFQKIGSTKFQHGIYGKLTGVVIHNNVFEEIAGAAVHQYAGGLSRKHGYRIYGNIFRKPVQFWDNTPRQRYMFDLILWVRNENWVYNNVFYGEGKRSAISMTKSENRIFNNTFIGCPVAIGFGTKSKDNWIQNNIFVDSGRGFMVWPTEAMPQKTLDYNIYFSTNGAPKWEHAGAAYSSFSEYQQASSETHSRYVDPSFVGPADAHLKADSPAIDAGIVLKVGLGLWQKEITDDVEGVARPQGSAPDIGAYEFSPATGGDRSL